jgi:hypothetical protein
LFIFVPTWAQVRVSFLDQKYVMVPADSWTTAGHFRTVVCKRLGVLDERSFALYEVRGLAPVRLSVFCLPVNLPFLDLVALPPSLYLSCSWALWGSLFRVLWDKNTSKVSSNDEERPLDFSERILDLVAYWSRLGNEFRAKHGKHAETESYHLVRATLRVKEALKFDHTTRIRATLPGVLGTDGFSFPFLLPLLLLCSSLPPPC